jgi:hypothetical protein
VADLDLTTRKPVKKYDRRSITSAENGCRAWGKHLETQIVELANSTKDERLKLLHHLWVTGDVYEPLHRTETGTGTAQAAAA